MARNLKQYLQEPDRLYRRVRDQHGQLHLSKKAAEYNPGPGRYRSSFKNARRLAATEINMAHRSADYERWQQLDFVVGIEVKLSYNHPVYDICDELAGKYPKDFKFVGWHPQCRCFAVPILKTTEEIQEETRRILAGEPTDTKSVNQVSDIPVQFKKWVSENRDRIAKAESRGTLPYFLKDNKKFVENITDEQFILTHFRAGVIGTTTSAYLSARSFNLTPAETLAVRIYTEDYFQTINHALWNGIDSEEVQIYTRVLNRALDKLDVYEGQVFRGTALTMQQLDEYRQYVQSGLPMTHPGFISTSIKHNVALGFTPNTMYFIRSKSGRHVSSMSNSKGEHEVLFKNGTEFRIISVGEDIIEFERVFKIIMEEI